MTAKEQTVMEKARAKAVKAWNTEALANQTHMLTADEVLDIILKATGPVFRNAALEEAAKVLNAWGDQADMSKARRSVIYEAAIVVEQMKDGTK